MKKELDEEIKKIFLVVKGFVVGHDKMRLNLLTSTSE